MTESLFREDSYLKECAAVVLRTTASAIVLDRTVFYAMGGGQPGDTGIIRWDGGNARIADTRYGSDGSIEHLVAENSSLPAAGTAVTAGIDWERRYRHMRMHTGLHLLGSVLRYGVTGGNISADKSRLDFRYGRHDRQGRRESATAGPWSKQITAYLADGSATPNLPQSRSWYVPCPCNRPKAPARCDCWRSRVSICSPAAART